MRRGGGRGARTDGIPGRGGRAGRGKKISVGLATAAAGRISAGIRRTSARNATRRGVHLTPDGSRLEELKERYTNRRNLLFKANCPTKSPKARAQMRFLEHVWHNDIKYTLGDIIAITDKTDNLQYFAQVRGLIVDPMMEAYAALTWLIPRQSATNPNQFDPEHFSHGLVDNTNYSLTVCEWISGRPQLPSYLKNWTPARAAAEGTRANAEIKWENLQRISKEELLRAKQKPLVNLVDRQNEEGACRI